MLTIDPRLYVEIVPYEGERSPVPHPVADGRFDPGRIYKVLGLYTPSETSEAYLILAREDGAIWFISNRHLRAYALLDSTELSLPKPRRAVVGAAAQGRMEPGLI
jgi:hypothetical protein